MRGINYRYAAVLFITKCKVSEARKTDIFFASFRKPGAN